MSNFHLNMETGPFPGKIIDLLEMEQFLGRDDNNTIIVNDPEISRRHCRFIFTDVAFELEDLGSTNGTFVNEKRISGRYKLKNGDVIRLGDNVSLVYINLGTDLPKKNIEDQVTIPQNMEIEDITPVSAGIPVPLKPPPIRPPMARPPLAVSPEEPVVEEKRRPNILTIGCAVILVIGVCVLLGAWFYIDTYAPEYYCYFLPFLPGCP